MMKAGRTKIELVAIYCPDCGEAVYDRDGHDWSEVSFQGKNKDDRWGPLTCTNCHGRFRMPVLVGRLGL